MDFWQHFFFNYGWRDILMWWLIFAGPLLVHGVRKWQEKRHAKDED